MRWRPGNTLVALQSDIAVPVTVPAAEAGGGSTLIEFRLSLRSHPELADHGFHDLAVVPGAWYIEVARQVYRDLFRGEAVSLRRIAFERPVILTEEEVVITVRVEPAQDGAVSFQFFEASKGEVLGTPDRAPGARLEIEREPERPSAETAGASPVDEGETTADAGPTESDAGFYSRLRRNGNQYGPRFQTLAGVAQAGSRAVAHFARGFPDSRGPLSTPMLDAASQLLSVFTLHEERTFILKSIDRLVVSALSGAGPVQAQALREEMAQAGEPGMTGSVQVCDAAGATLWEALGVRLAFIDRPKPAALPPVPATRLCVASTFTAEPLAEALGFWGDYFQRPARVEFAPYNQVFQELLNPASGFHGNRDGINVIVLRLEDWLRAEPSPVPPPAPAHLSAALGDRPRAILPNGLEVAHLNRHETDYLYQEIFVDESYLRHGIQLADGDTVIDIGANIGLFSLFVASRCRNPSIYAFEPSPRVFDLLQANCAAYGDPARVRAFNCGVSSKKGHAAFTFYEHSSVFSTFHPNESEDRAAVQAVARNVLQHELSGGGVEEADIEDLTTHRLQSETIECALTSVSDIIRDHRLEQIHLLKIDAEKSEREILSGIAEEHWPLIEQVVIEVHDPTRAEVAAIEAALTRRGFHCAVVEEKLLEDSGLFNLFATRRAPTPGAVEPKKGVRKTVDDFCAALDTFAGSVVRPLVLAIAPGEPKAALAEAEATIVARAVRHAQVTCLRPAEILARYPVREWHDPHGHQLGHVPFTPEGYLALGTAISRAVFQLAAPPVKVIAVDCDNTLWQGQCGEDGPAGVQIPLPYRRLQEFLVAQHAAGRLIVLCSKNQEADALGVFACQPGMPLRREHLAGWQINWKPKSENLRALAAQLNLGLESFVFLDDNPVECAEVRAGCPEVLALQLPTESSRISAFLDHMWVFDRGTATAEDRDRQRWYQANSEREEVRAAAPTLRDFLAGLELKIEVAEASEEQLARVAQLTARTNQFNLTSRRRSEAEIRQLVRSGARCLVTHVRDRFGDYGLVGVILYTVAADRFVVDTLLLSCRALGKGVEHRMVADLAERALREGKTTIELAYEKTERNEPAAQFVAQLGSLLPGARQVRECSAAALAALRYEPESRVSPGEPALKAPTASREGGWRDLSAAMQRLGEELNSVDAIAAAAGAARSHPAPAGSEPLEDASALEQALLAIWKKTLGRTHVRLDENFFDAGGTSLKAVVVLAAVRQELKRLVSIVTLFECPTIRSLAARLQEPADSAGNAAEVAARAEARGRLRRAKLITRRST